MEKVHKLSNISLGNNVQHKLIRNLKNKTANFSVKESRNLNFQPSIYSKGKVLISRRIYIYIKIYFNKEHQKQILLWISQGVLLGAFSGAKLLVLNRKWSPSWVEYQKVANDQQKTHRVLASPKHVVLNKLQKQVVVVVVVVVFFCTIMSSVMIISTMFSSKCQTAHLLPHCSAWMTPDVN